MRINFGEQAKNKAPLIKRGEIPVGNAPSAVQPRTPSAAQPRTPSAVQTRNLRTSSAGFTFPNNDIPINGDSTYNGDSANNVESDNNIAPNDRSLRYESMTLPARTENTQLSYRSQIERLPPRPNSEFQESENTQATYGKLASLMSDPTVEEIWINSPNRIFIARYGVSELTNLVMTAEEVQNLVERLLMWGGRRLDLTHPFVDARLPDGSRLHAAIPEITQRHWAINIRKHLMRGKSLAELMEMGVMSSEVSEYLTKAVVSGANILVAGSTQAGKTTLLNALIGELPLANRVITVEEVFELKPQTSDCVAMQTRTANLQGEGAIPLRGLIKEALRMRPNNLIVGEIREAESLDLLIALNSGLPGMATIHANSARDAIAKLQTLPLLAGENISYEFIAPIVATAISLVVFVAIDSTGRRRIMELSRLTGRIEANRVELEEVFILESENNETNSPNYRRGLGA